MKICKPTNLIPKPPRTSGVLCAAGVLLAGFAALPAPSYADDIVVHPASCVAPFLNQAFPMRWHEHFIMNPSNNVATYVICPMNFDPSVVTLNSGGSFSVQVIGGRMDDAGTALPTCVFKVHRNTNLKQGIYIDRAPTQIYSEGMTSNSSGSLWAASVGVVRTDVSDDLETTSQYEWALSTVCLLPPGYGISQVRLLD